MRKINFNTTLSFLFLLCFIGSCQREKSYINPDGRGPVTDNSQKVTASVTGRIVDENNTPVQGAQIKAGNSITLTDINGNFLISNTELEKNIGYIRVEKQGYFPGSRTIIVKEGTLNFISIQLIPKNIVGTVNATTGGNVTLANGGGTISFPSNGFVTVSNNSAYSGTVSIAAFTFDPTASNFTDLMPGALRGYTTSNDERGLQSFSMMAVELTGAGGEKLQLASGKQAVITFPIPAALQATAPQNIPLWFFDEVKGLWKEEGTATRQGANYIGSVSHFSFWNCDAPFPLVNFETQIKDQNNNVLRGQKVEIRFNANQSSGFSLTDTSGNINGLIPANQPLQLLVYNSCNTTIHTQNIGPFNTSAKLGTINVNTGNMMNIPVSGTVKDCNNASISSGTVTLFVSGKVFRATVVNGNFATTVFSCSPTTSIKAIAYNATANQYGDTVTVQTTGSTATTLNLTACGNTANQFINYTLNGTLNSMIVPGDSIIFNRFNPDIEISGYSQNFTKYIGFKWNYNDTIPGTYPLNYLYVSHGMNQQYNKTGMANITITSYGKINEFIEGSFTGNVRDSSNAINYAISCNFKIKRTR